MAIPAYPSNLKAVTTKKFSAHTDRVRSLAWNNDGRRLASGGADKILRIWLPEKDTQTSTQLVGHSGQVSCVKWNPSKGDLLSTCSSSVDRNVYFWDIRLGKPTSSVSTVGENINLAWSPDGRYVIVGSSTDVVTWIDVVAGKVSKTEKLKAETNEFTFSPAGDIWFRTFEGTVEIQSFPAAEALHTVDVSPVATCVLDLDPRARYLAAGSNDATVTLWETREWTCARSNGSLEGAIRHLAFSPDGSYLAAASEDPFILLSDVPSLTEAHRIATDGGGLISAMDWHPTRPLLAYASDEPVPHRGLGSFKIWGL